jgi:hypothetical protein
MPTVRPRQCARRSGTKRGRGTAIRASPQRAPLQGRGRAEQRQRTQRSVLTEMRVRVEVVVLRRRLLLVKLGFRCCGHRDGHRRVLARRAPGSTTHRVNHSAACLVESPGVFGGGECLVYKPVCAAYMRARLVDCLCACARPAAKKTGSPLCGGSLSTRGQSDLVVSLTVFRARAPHEHSLIVATRHLPLYPCLLPFPPRVVPCLCLGARSSLSPAVSRITVRFLPGARETKPLAPFNKRCFSDKTVSLGPSPIRTLGAPDGDKS